MNSYNVVLMMEWLITFICLYIPIWFSHVTLTLRGSSATFRNDNTKSLIFTLILLQIEKIQTHCEHTAVHCMCGRAVFSVHRRRSEISGVARRQIQLWTLPWYVYDQLSDGLFSHERRQGTWSREGLFRSTESHNEIVCALMSPQCFP